MTTKITSLEGQDDNGAAVLRKQVADWTKERDRLQDLIDHATGAPPLSQPHQAVVAAGVPTVLVEQVRAAMKRAYGLGQTYWQQADSEYVSQHKKSEATAQRFRDLNESICAMLAAAPLPPAPAPVERAICPHGCTSPENGGSGCMAVTGDCAMSAPPVGQALDLAAIRDQVLEEAAKVADTFVTEQLDGERIECGQDIARAIRALRSAPVNPVSENGGES